MRLLARTLAVILLFGASSALVGAEAPALFRAGLVDPLKVLPAPALLDTEEMKAELQTVLRAQEARTDKEIKRAREDEQIRTDSFQSALGPWLTANNLPRLQALFERMEKEAKVCSDIAKNHFKRPRPLVADARVKPLFEMSDPGYPSGHSLRGQMFALVLSELAPDKADTLLARGREIGWSRVIGGVHFPSDLSAGRTLGQALALEMLANPAIRTELAAIHREFEAARQKSGEPELCTWPTHRNFSSGSADEVEDCLDGSRSPIIVIEAAHWRPVAPICGRRWRPRNRAKEGRE
jgi:acid phosphatase (class A)